MEYRLLLVNGHREAVVSELRILTLRQLPGAGGLSIHFRPVRSDMLFESARSAGQLAYRILAGEGVARDQLWVEYELTGEATNVVGRSSELLFALALLTATWKNTDCNYTSIAATGMVDSKGDVLAVDHTIPKLQAAMEAMGGGQRSVIFYPSAESAQVVHWLAANATPEHVDVRPIARIEEALDFLGYKLRKVYLRNPFRGLGHFEFEDHPIFFGRDAEVRELIAQLLRREAAGVPGVLVEGASGSGKSSFLRAAVLPALVNPRSHPAEVQEQIAARPFAPHGHLALWRPGLLPAGADERTVVASIRISWSTLPQFVAYGVASEPETFQGLAEWQRTGWPTAMRFVWVIDQLEELFSIDLDPGLIEAFGLFLLGLQHQGAWILSCIRADAAPRLKECEALRRVFGSNEGQYYLSTLHGVALDDVIGRPAAAAGLTFGAAPDGRTLDRVMREDAYSERNSLPLLQFALNKLYETRSEQVMTHQAYKKLGGLAGSIASTINEIVNECGPRSAAVLESAFRSLVAVDDSGKALRRYAPLAEVSADFERRHMMMRFVQARLCVTDQRDGVPVIAFSHDTLIYLVPGLTAWLQQEAALIQSRDLAEREAGLWQKHGETNAWLARDDKLAIFRSLACSEVPLPQPVKRFIDRSVHRAAITARVKKLAVGLFAGLAIIATIAGWVAVQKQHEAEDQTAQALHARSRLLTEVAMQRLKDGDISTARAVILEVLGKPAADRHWDPFEINTFQEIRARDPQLAVLAGHQGTILTAAFSPDGERVVTASLDKTAVVWNARTGTRELALVGHASYVLSAIYSPDGLQIATTSSDGTARIWDARTGETLRVLPGIGRGLAYSSDGSRLAVTTTDGRSVRLLDAGNGRSLLDIKAPAAELYTVAFAPDGHHIAAVASDRTVRIFDVHSGRQVTSLSGHWDSVASAKYSPDSRRIVTASHDGEARVWDAQSGQSLLLLSRRGSWMVDASYSPDGAKIVTASTDKTARVWDAESGAELATLSGHAHILSTASFSPDSRKVVTAAFDYTARIWRSGLEDATLVIPDYNDSVSEAVFSQDGTMIAAASGEKTVRLRDSRTGEEKFRLVGHSAGVNSVAVSQDGTHILTTAQDRTSRIWDAATGRSLMVLSDPRSNMSAAVFSPDGTRIATPVEDDVSVQLWDAESGDKVLKLSGGQDEVNAAQFSPDGTRIATGSTDKTVRVWDAANGKALMILSKGGDQIDCVAYSPDGKFIIAGGEDHTARIWDAASGNQTAILLGHAVRVNRAVFSPDGRQIATASADRTVRIWDANSYEQLEVLYGHTGVVYSVAYSRDGERLVSGAKDRTVRVWNARTPADLRTQITWEHEVETDPIPDAERARIGLDLEKPNFRAAPASPCDLEAGAIYDPDRRAPGVEQSHINADIAVAACTGSAAADQSARAIYERGRALVAAGHSGEAQALFENLLTKNYRAANVDLAMLLLDESAHMLDRRRAIALLEHAWKSGLPIAAYELGKFYEFGAESANAAGKVANVESWNWYEKAAQQGEPNALARMAARDEAKAMTLASEADRNRLLLRAFGFYKRAAERAHVERWPDTAWSSWRYHRATLARYLASEGMMQQVADIVSAY